MPETEVTNGMPVGNGGTWRACAEELITCKIQIGIIPPPRMQRRRKRSTGLLGQLAASRDQWDFL